MTEPNGHNHADGAADIGQLAGNAFIGMANHMLAHAAEVSERTDVDLGMAQVYATLALALAVEKFTGTIAAIWVQAQGMMTPEPVPDREAT